SKQDWYSMWLEFGRVEGQLRFYIDPSIGNNPENAYALFLDVNTAEVMRVQRYTDWTPGGRAWTVGRYLHTGEYFGLIGQTIAGLASLAACFLVYTGFLLSWRRLVSPYFTRKT
ncbi:MAG: PepSY-associated TM helix domain-containing protein, partial [Paraglaciecola sp.]|uniref:PepSY-associated TM helix domain-containing protein n=1 Tax=Paraglaciecola sp. TaxID=1920173 RepID=UPI0032969B7E